MNTKPDTCIRRYQTPASWVVALLYDSTPRVIVCECGAAWHWVGDIICPVCMQKRFDTLVGRN